MSALSALDAINTTRAWFHRPSMHRRYWSLAPAAVSLCTIPPGSRQEMSWQRPPCFCVILQPYVARLQPRVAAQKEVGGPAPCLVDCPSLGFRKVYLRFCICICIVSVSVLALRLHRPCSRVRRHRTDRHIEQKPSRSLLRSVCLASRPQSSWPVHAIPMQPVCAGYEFHVALAASRIDIWSNIVLCGLR